MAATILPFPTSRIVRDLSAPRRPLPERGALRSPHLERIAELLVLRAERNGACTTIEEARASLRQVVAEMRAEGKL